MRLNTHCIVLLVQIMNPGSFLYLPRFYAYDPYGARMGRWRIFQRHIASHILPKIHVMCILSCSNIIKMIHISLNVISVSLKEDLSDKCGLNVVVLPAMFLTTTHMGPIWVVEEKQVR